MFGGGQGAYGEKVAVPWQNLVPLPDNMTYDQGAGTCSSKWPCYFLLNHYTQGLYITWPTSYEALVGRAELKAGKYLSPAARASASC